MDEIDASDKVTLEISYRRKTHDRKTERTHEKQNFTGNLVERHVSPSRNRSKIERQIENRAHKNLIASKCLHTH